MQAQIKFLISNLISNNEQLDQYLVEFNIAPDLEQLIRSRS